MYRITARNVPRTCRAAPSRNMFTTPFFPHFGGSPMGAFSNDLFRLLDSATADLVPQSSRNAPRRSFTPRFDVREAGPNYELQGELPGFEQKDLDIEFIDERTLVIRGKTTSEQRQPSTPVVGDGAQKAVAAEETADDNVSEKSANYQKASVEDEYVDAGAESKDGAKTPASTTNGEITEAAEGTKAATAEPAFKYWVSERSAGEFERRFSFPGRVNQDEVRASLRNGILSVVVPKIAEQGMRRIAVQ